MTLFFFYLALDTHVWFFSVLSCTVHIFDMFCFLWFVLYIHVFYIFFIMHNVFFLVFYYPSVHSQFLRLSQLLFPVSPFLSTFHALLSIYFFHIIMQFFVTFSPFLLVRLYCQPPIFQYSCVMLHIHYQYGSNG